jgi:hypothetical protein
MVKRGIDRRPLGNWEGFVSISGNSGHADASFWRRHLGSYTMTTLYEHLELTEER